MSTPVSEQTRGGLFAFSAYLLWGVLPVYFVLLLPTGPWEIVAWRVLFSLVVCALLLTVLRGWRAIAEIVRQPRLLGWTLAAGVLIYGNWQIFLLGTLSGRIIETSLGYFINPLVTVLLGVVFLRERLRVMQWVAIGIAAGAVVVIIVGYGAFPWVALGLALTFSLYSFIKKKQGDRVDAVSGLTLETAWLTPVAIVQLVLVATTTGVTLGTVSPLHTILLCLTGVVTALPLLLFAAGARRVPLTVVGLLQFLTPIMQFIFGAAVMGEPMPLERWIGFGLVWIALIVLSIDMIRAMRRAHRLKVTAAAASDPEKTWTGSTPLPK